MLRVPLSWSQNTATSAAYDQYASDWPKFERARPARVSPGPEQQKLAIVLYGKIGNEIQRTFTPYAKASSGVLGLAYNAMRETILEPAAPHFKAIDIFGHSWSPEAKDLIEAMYKPTATSFEADMMSKFDLACRRKAHSRELGGPGFFYPISCGRTMSHMLGMQRAIALKAAHERAQGFEYRAVLVSRWDVLWQSSKVGTWLVDVASRAPLDKLWMPDNCGEEAHGSRDIESAETAYKARVCGVDDKTVVKRSAPTKVSTGAASCGKANRGCDWDMRPGTRGLFLVDWWFLSSSALADGFGRAWDGFENATATVKNELVSADKVKNAGPRGHILAGIWTFGHFYWGLQIVRNMQAPVDWAPLTMGNEYTLVRMAKDASSELKCHPTAEQLMYGAAKPVGFSRMAARVRQRLVVPPTFELAAAPGNGSHAPQFSDEMRRIGLGAPGSPQESPLVRSCRAQNRAFATGRIFMCPGSSRACAAQQRIAAAGEMPGGSVAVTAGLYLETTKDWFTVARGCPVYGSGSLGGAQCVRGLRGLWTCLRASPSADNCTSWMKRIPSTAAELKSSAFVGGQREKLRYMPRPAAPKKQEQQQARPYKQDPARNPAAVAPGVLEIWPTSGPVRGGTRIWFSLPEGSFAAPPSGGKGGGGGGGGAGALSRSGAVSVGLRLPNATDGGIVQVAGAGGSLHSSRLGSLVTPPLPEGLRPPVTAHLSVAGIKAARMGHGFTYVRQRGGEGTRPLTWKTLRGKGDGAGEAGGKGGGQKERHLDGQDCEESLACREPPPLFDRAVGLRLPSGRYRTVPAAGWQRPKGRETPGGAAELVPRAIPPGSTCEVWSLLRAMNVSECARSMRHLPPGTRYGARLRANTAGCVLAGDVVRPTIVDPTGPAKFETKNMYTLCLGPASG